jgi:hypothetical protein
MRIEDLEIGMAVRFENQKYKGTDRYVREWAGDVHVQFEGFNEPEQIDPMFLRPF